MTEKDGLRYYEGSHINLSKDQKKRCIIVLLTGQDKIAMPCNSINLTPIHIEFCFGARNVRVKFSGGLSVPLAKWLAYDKEFLRKFLGFSGPEETNLFIVFKKESLL